MWGASAQFTEIQIRNNLVKSKRSIHRDLNPEQLVKTEKRVLRSTGIKTRDICSKGEASAQIRRYSNLRFVAAFYIVPYIF